MTVYEKPEVLKMKSTRNSIHFNLFCSMSFKALFLLIVDIVTSTLVWSEDIFNDCGHFHTGVTLSNLLTINSDRITSTHTRAKCHYYFCTISSCQQ